MKLRTRRKIRRNIAWTLGILSLILALVYAYFKDKIIETSIIIVSYYIFRYLFEKQWHAKSMYICFCITTAVLIVLINIDLKISISILFSVILTFILTLISYYVRDYLDTKVLNKYYEDKLNKFKHKALENLTEDEMIELMPNIKYEIIHMVYGYLHRPKTLSASGYAYRNNISDATLYRYLKQIKDKYESLG